MTREASVATLRRLGEALLADNRERGAYESHCAGDPTFNEVVAALRVYQHEIAPLRTREQVNADKNAVTLQLFRQECDYKHWRERFAELDREPTRDSVGEPYLTCADCGLTRDQEPTVAVRWDSRPRCNSCAEKRPLGKRTNSGPSSADAEEVPSPRPPASPAGADYFQAMHDGILELAIHVQELESAMQDANPGWSGPRLYVSLIPDWPTSGPPGAVAAKESRDNAAAPEGAAFTTRHGDVISLEDPESHACNPGERDCNCDQALELEDKLKEARRLLKYAQQRGLEIAEALSEVP